jgi:hypothetical protein
MSFRAQRGICSWIAILAATLTLDACGAFRRSGPAIEQEDVTIVVNNQSFPDVVIYIVPSGDPRRIGMVTGSSSTTLKVPYRQLSTGTLQLLARPIAGRSYLLPAVTVSPGDEVNVTINNVPSQSIVTVAPR